MKKLTSLIFAVVSTMFLAAGATHAAEKFDVLTKSGQAVSGPSKDGPTPPPPCVIIDEPKE